MPLRSIIAGMVICAIAVLAGGCKKEQPQPPAAIPSPAATTAEAAPIAPAAPPTATPAEEPSKATSQPASDLGDAYTANKKRLEGTRPNDKALQRELDQLRPKRRESISLDGKRIDVNFTGAAVGSGDFHLCDLTFELTDGTNTATATMTDKQRDVALAADLGWCKLKVKPYVTPAQIDPIGTGQVMSRMSRLGRYDVLLLDSAGKPMGIAQITEDRRLLAGKAYGGYSCFMRRDPEWEDEQIFNLSKVAADGKSKKILQLRWRDQALTHHDVTDQVGNIYEHAFPAGELEVINPGKK